MKVDRVDPTVVRLTAHVREVAALISAARWITDGCPGELPSEAVGQLRRVVAAYDKAIPAKSRPPAAATPRPRPHPACPDEKKA